LRGLWKNPGFSAVAVLSLALGIGANTAIFSVINAVLLRPLPYHEPERLVMVWEDASFAGFPQNTPAPANYADWKSQNQTLEDMAALAQRSFNLTGDGEPERLDAYAVTANFFPLLGVKPALGRSFLAEEDKPDTNKVVMLSYKVWQQRYGGDRSVVGRDLLLNGEKYNVVGVAPAGFQFLESEIGLWVPIRFTQQELANRGGHYLWVVGRMKPGVTLEQANADIKTVMSRIARDHQGNAGRIGAYVMSMRDQLAGDSRRPLIVLLVAVGFVLLIACANIANLLLSRAASRSREIAVRSALGAGRMRIVRQLLTESLLLSFAGAIVGLLFATWSFSFLQQLIPPGLELSTNLNIDLRILGFTLLVSLGAGLIFGLAPALQASKVDLNEALKQSGGRAGLGGGNKLRSAMVVAEVAMSLVLLVGAGLLIQTFFKMLNQYSGLQSENVLLMRTNLPRGKYNDSPKRAAFYDQVLERVKSLPGVVSAGYTMSVPLDWKGGTSGFWIEGRTAEQALAQGLSYDANHRQVSADYLKTMGIPLLRGRHLAESDNERSMPVVMINETMARQYWPGEDAVGKRFKLGDPDSPEPWRTIVGVVADVRQMGMDEPVKSEMYLPYRQMTTHSFFAPRDLVVRTSADPMSVIAAARREIHAVDPDQPVSNIRTMEEVLGKEIGQRRLGMTLVAIFAGLALLLASLGIYGVLSYFVVQHTREIGVRMALGAARRDVLGLVMKKGMSLTLAGVGIGLSAAFALTRLMSSLLYEVSAVDPATFAGVAALLTLIALLACYIPARRAMKVDPMIALRYE
jgi:putative ABC transport system permease protein